VAAVPLEQLHTKLLFQAFYRPAQPRLGNVQAILGCPRKVQLFAHGNETLQPVEINIYRHKPLRPSYSSVWAPRLLLNILCKFRCVSGSRRRFLLRQNPCAIGMNQGASIQRS